MSIAEKPSINGIYILTEKYLPECLELLHAAFGTVALQFGLTSDNCPTSAAFMTMERLESNFKYGTPYGYFLDGRIVGYFSLIRPDVSIDTLDNRDEDYMLINLAVHPDFRHYGFGTELIAASKQAVKKIGGTRMKLRFIKENKILKKWYEKNGFIYMGAEKFAHIPYIVGHMECKIE